MGESELEIEQKLGGIANRCAAQRLTQSKRFKIRTLPGTEDESRRLTPDNLEQRMQSDRQLQLLNDRFAMALKGAPIVLCCQDLDLRYTWIHNPALGYEASAVIGKRDVDLFERADDARVLESLKRDVIQTGVGRRQEVTIFSQGTPHCYDLLVEPLVEDGRITGVRCAALDISAVKNAERKARENEDRLQLGLAVAELGLAELDYRTGLNHLSAAAAKLFGLGDSDVVLPRAAVHATFHPDDRSELNNRIAQCLTPAGKGWFSMDHRVIWPNGQVRWLRVRKQVFFEGEGASRHAVRAMLAAVDITDLANAQSIAEASSRAKDRFLAMLSHELRTPLGPVLMTLDHLARDASLPADSREMLEMVRRNVSLEVRLIDDLLDITRISSGKLKLQVTLIDAHEKVNHVLDMLREEIDYKSLDVTFRPAAVMHHIQGDKDRFQQIIWNLLKNAIKFTPPRGRIVVSTFNTTTSDLEIAISDTGMGIPPEAMPKIFEAFEQGDEKITHRFGGLGLGLAISKALVELHGGTLRVFSAGDGMGSTFTLSIPEASLASHQDGDVDSRNTKPLGCSILLVEDHPDTRRTMVRLLKSLGCEVEAAGSIAEALALAEQSGRFNLVISDIGLPDGSGIDLMRQLKARHNLKGIALTGYGMEDDLLSSRAAGFDAHLVKPVNLDKLVSTVRSLSESSILQG